MKKRKIGLADIYDAILETNRLIAFGFESIKADTSSIMADTAGIAGIKADTSALVRAALRADERLIRIEAQLDSDH